MTGNILVLFDIDGTLLRVGDPFHGQALLDAVRHVYAVEPDLDGIPRAGMLDAQILRLILEKHEIDPERAEAGIGTVMEVMGQQYETAMRGHPYQERLLPGAREAVEATMDHGWTAGVLTGNARTVAVLKLQASGLGAIAEIGAYGDSARARSALVQAAHDEAEQRTGTRFAPGQTVLIGDTPNDITAAREADVRVVAVATGRYSLDALVAHHPDSVLPDLTDTATFIHSIESVVECS